MREINKSEIVKYINILGKFCGKRDIQELTTLELKKKYNIKKRLSGKPEIGYIKLYLFHEFFFDGVSFFVGNFLQNALLK